MLSWLVSFFRQRYRALTGILTEHVSNVHRKGAVHRANVLQLVMYNTSRGENRKLPGENVEKNQRQSDEEHDWRKTHQKIGHDQAIADLPQKAEEDEPPEQRNTENQEQEEVQRCEIAEELPECAWYPSGQRERKVADKKPERASMHEAFRLIAAHKAKHRNLKLSQSAHVWPV
jgi:hypothetical protein